MSLFLSRQRFKVLFIHCIFSTFLLVVALYLVYGVWYPTPLATAMGVGSLYVMMLIVDLILGPILTFIVYKEDKRKFLFDMVVILCIQVTAYIGGLYVMHQGKPAWLVFVKDDIELVSPIDISEPYRKDLKEQFEVHFYNKPMWIVADYGTDVKKRQQLINDEMFDGISIVVRPETYRPFETKSKELVKKLKSNDLLNEINNVALVQREISSLNRKPAGWLPVKAPEVDMVAFFDSTGKVIKIVNLRPWQ